MKQSIHPTYYTTAKIVCACGNSFAVGSTVEESHVELCSKCHPFYTGKQKLVDTAGRVEKFKQRASKKDTVGATRLGKRVKKTREEAKKKAAAEE